MKAVVFLFFLLFLTQCAFSQDTVMSYDFVSGKDRQLIRQSCHFPRDRTGVIVIKDSSGTKRLEASILNDSLHGHYRSYYESGVLENDEYYLKGKQQDTSRYYFPNGKLSSEEVYEDNKVIYFQLFNSDGSEDTLSESPDQSPSFSADLAIFLSKNMEQLLANIDDEEYLRKLSVTFQINEQGQTEKVIVKWGAYSCTECKKELTALSAVPSWRPKKLHNRPMVSYLTFPIMF